MTVIWRGDELGAWTGSEVADKTRIAQVNLARDNAPIKAFRFQVRQADLVQNGVRAELIRDDHRQEGVERYTRFSVLFPKNNFAVMDKQWQVFHQYHQSYIGVQTIGRSPPVEFALNGSTMQLNVNDWHAPNYAAKTLWSTPLEFDKWYDFVLHARWSSTPAYGFLHLYLGGKEVLPKTATLTMFPGYEVYMKTGIYRSRSIVPDSMVYQYNFMEATTLEDVLSPTTVAPPTPPVLVAPAPVWRVGVESARIVYKNNMPVGVMDTPELASAVVTAMNKG